MKIVFFIGTVQYGGAEKHALMLADYYRNHLGWDTEIWCWSGSGEFRDGPIHGLASSINIPVRMVPVFRIDNPDHNTFLKRVQYWRFINRQNIDVVMSFNPKPNIFCAYMLPWTNVKAHVWAQQNVGYDFPSPKERKAIRGVKHAVSNSSHGAAFLKKVGFKNDSIHVVHNGINTDVATVDSRDWTARIAPHQQSVNFNAIMVANISKTKDHITLIKAWKRVVEKLNPIGIKANLYLAGRQDTSYEDVVAIIHSMQLTEHVHLLGQVSDVYNLIALMDLSVLSSPAEGMPNAVLECMLMGKPFVGTDIEGIREAVGECNIPYLTPVGDAESLARVILPFAEDKELCEKVGKANREHVQSNFPIKKMWEATHAIVLKSLGKSTDTI